jgi:hypothetical protein
VFTWNFLQVARQTLELPALLNYISLDHPNHRTQCLQVDKPHPASIEGTLPASASCPVRKHAQTAQTCANDAQTFLCFRTICANMHKHVQTCANMSKPTPMFAQVIQLPDKYQALRKHAQTCANAAQTLCKHCANAAQTLSKHCANTAQTRLRKH